MKVVDTAMYIVCWTKELENFAQILY